MNITDCLDLGEMKDRINEMNSFVMDNGNIAEEREINKVIQFNLTVEPIQNFVWYKVKMCIQILWYQIMRNNIL